MSANQLPLSNVIEVSASEAPVGVGEYNTSNLALFTTEPFANSFGTLGYNIYLDPTQIGVDFGTASQTYQMAVQVFSQQPNILLGGGYLVVIPLILESQLLTLSGVPASGSFTLTYGGNTTAAINWNDTTSVIQTKIQAVQGLSAATVTGTLAGEALTVKFYGLYGPLSLFTVGGAGLETSGSSAITVTPTASTVGETMTAAISRTANLVQYFGLMYNFILGQSDMLAAAATVQTLNKIMFVGTNDPASMSPGGYIDLLETGRLDQSRGLFYGGTGTTDVIDLLIFVASYAGRALSTNFSGSNTTQNMHLKQLIGVQPDPTMTQAYLALAKTSGADVYVSLGGQAAVFSSGANRFFDQVYNEQWFVGALQVAGFNYLAGTSTKIPQTQNGIDGLNDAYRQVCEQAVVNGYCAPGTWNSATTFGNQANFLQNITQVGYYIYSQPIGQQSQANRVARVAPLAQIALKEAGGVNSATVLVIVNP